jgi:hypothetical protein
MCKYRFRYRILPRYYLADVVGVVVVVVAVPTVCLSTLQIPINQPRSQPP